MLILGMKYNLFGSSLCCVAWDQSILAPLPLANLCSRNLIPVRTFSSQEQIDKSHVLSKNCVRMVHAQISSYATLINK